MWPDVFSAKCCSAIHSSRELPGLYRAQWNAEAWERMNVRFATVAAKQKRTFTILHCEPVFSPVLKNNEPLQWFGNAKPLVNEMAAPFVHETCLYAVFEYEAWTVLCSLAVGSSTKPSENRKRRQHPRRKECHLTGEHHYAHDNEHQASKRSQ